ncbi:MAG: hypothetical protein A2X35_02665 [Elusimicrobia bacterium GWA2_61_42]|nr:MAG: hypothetical protein A2X35_02665 [Elusimicrobia bacterium GWA2_61_42]
MNDKAILIVEDDPGTSELEAQRLEPLGLKILRAASSEETVAALRKGTPELMLLDYSLPGANAIQLIKTLRGLSINVPPFIVVTGRGDEAVAVEAMKAGALDYIVKNSDFLENLLPAARKVLEKVSLIKDLEAAQSTTAKSMRLYNFLAQVNLAAAQAKDRDTLFRSICDIAVNTGRLRMAWIALPDTDLGRILPFCWAGFNEGYLSSIKIDLGQDSPFSKGPTGIAASSGKIWRCSDIATDPGMAPWRDKALEQGYRSSAAIPLEEDGKLAAVLTIYSESPGFFTDDELKLLGEIKADISLALDAISAEEKRGKAQTALERTARQLAHVMDATPVILFTLKRKGDRTITDWVSGNAFEMTGYTPEEILNPDWWPDNLHPDDKTGVLEEQKELFKKASLVQDFRFRKKNGTYFWVHSQLKVPVPGNGEITGSWTDITKLKESEERFQELFREAPVGYQALDGDGNILAVNNTWKQTFGREEKEVLNRNFAEFLEPHSRDIFKEKFPECAKSGAFEGLEFEVLRADGSARRISLSGRVAQAPDGTIKQSHCVFTDITDTWKAREQTDLLSQAVRASFNEVYIFDPEDFHFIFVNLGAVKNLGYTPEELEKMTPWDLKRAYTPDSFRAAVAPLLEGKHHSLIFESEHTRKNGTVYAVEIRLQLVETGRKRVFLAVINDITERKKSDKIMMEMVTMQRVESLGQLAGGIAHDFNNMLTGIMANISLLEARCGGDKENAEILRETIEAAHNAQSLTASLLAFSKGGKPVKQEFCLRRALQDIFSLATSGTTAACRIAVPEQLWSVNGDENQLKQAINNLLMNGLQAMPGGGVLKLEACNIGKEVRPPAPLEPGEYVKITVSDTGMGIPAELLTKIFDPYFTTKKRGHGLGLSMAWSVVKNHGGDITASSTPGKGSSFDIYLPATGRSMSEEVAVKKDIVKGTGRILVLEDEEVVANAVRRMLGALGYECEVVTDGRDAVRRYDEEAKNNKPFAAVIMDLTIPGGMGGKQAVAELRKTAPRARVIVSSGYSDEAVMADYKANGFDAVLPKPYKYEDLAETLARLLKE